MSDYDTSPQPGQNASGFTDFDGRQHPLSAEANDATRPMPVTASPPPPLPPTRQELQDNDRRRRGGAARLALIAALVLGLLVGGVGGGFAGYQLGNGGSNTAAAPAASTGGTRGNTVAAVTPTITGSPATGAASQPQISASVAPGSALADLVARVNPAVVTVNVEVAQQTNPFGQSAPGAQTGSGYIIDNQGYVVTNNHVIDGGTSISLTLQDGTKVPATVVGTDPFQDIAVLKFNGKAPATVAFGDSSKVREGDSVIAIGSALGEFRNTVTNGIISGIDRSLDTGQGYRLGNLIQHTAPISPGNSGGPLLNTQGEVIGMNTAVVRGNSGAAAEGLGFAIASNTVKKIADQIIANGRPNYPYMGVSFADAGTISQSLAGGVVLTKVQANGPAAQAGLRQGDIITAIDGVKLTAEQPFLNQIFTRKPGDTVQLTVTRADGTNATLSVTLAERPAAQ